MPAAPQATYGDVAESMGIAKGRVKTLAASLGWTKTDDGWQSESAPEQRPLIEEPGVV